MSSSKWGPNLIGPVVSSEERKKSLSLHMHALRKSTSTEKEHNLRVENFVLFGRL